MSKTTGAPGRRQVYGRRFGKKLRPGLQAVYDQLLPGLKIPLSEDAPDPLAPDQLFDPRPGKIWMEIGFGGGEHLVHQATLNPEIGFLGCEPFINGMARLLRQIATDGLTNIRIHDGDARDLLAALPDASIDRIFLLYPDPWPKRRHHKRRFVQPDTLQTLARVMADRTELRIATDIPDYVDWTLYHFQGNENFDWQAQSPKDWRQPFPGWPGTRYEIKAQGEGRRPTYLTFVRRRRD